VPANDAKILILRGLAGSRAERDRAVPAQHDVLVPDEWLNGRAAMDYTTITLDRAKPPPAFPVLLS
jgi:hypothetical protein